MNKRWQFIGFNNFGGMVFEEKVAKEIYDEVEYNNAIEMDRRSDGVWQPRRRPRAFEFHSCDNFDRLHTVSGSEAAFVYMDECGPVQTTDREPTSSRSVGSFESEVERVQTATGRFKRRWADRDDSQLQNVRRAIRSIS